MDREPRAFLGRYTLFYFSFLLSRFVIVTPANRSVDIATQLQYPIFAPVAV